MQINPITQLFTFLWFSFFCFGFSVLAADAHVFGCNIYDYEEKGPRIARHIGIIPLRHIIIQVIIGYGIKILL